MSWKNRFKEYKKSCTNYEEFNSYWINHACAWCREHPVEERDVEYQVWEATMTKKHRDYLCYVCKEIPTAVRAINKRFPEWKKINALDKSKWMRNLANRGYLYMKYVHNVKPSIS